MEYRLRQASDDPRRNLAVMVQTEDPMIQSPTSKLICFGQAKRLTLGGIFNLPPENDVELRP